jgi:microcystin-dependent protein
MSRKQAKFMRSAMLSAAMAASFVASSPARAEIEPFIGEMMVVGFTFCPRGWVAANGQILAIAQNTALFSLLGTTYGGNGQTTFALPDLRSRAPIHNGQGPGLASYDLGQLGGTESTTLTINNLPSHTHNVQATNALGDKGGPGDKILAAKNTDPKPYFEGTPNKLMAPTMITFAGNSLPVSILRPYVAMTMCIATEGIFPSRN